jgi:hypothetical protein
VEVKEKLCDSENEFTILNAKYNSKLQLIESMDQELVRLSVKAIELKSALTQNKELLIKNDLLLDGLTWSVKDLFTLTNKRSYSAKRKLRLLFQSLIKRRLNGVSVQRDVLPIHADPTEYVKTLVEFGFNSSEYFEVNQDVEASQINPFSHFQHIGLKENRKIR